MQKVQSIEMETKPPAYPFKYQIMSKSEGPKTPRRATLRRNKLPDP